ncbi:MAG: RluA family pseudouridine synthase [Clostridia bacterium]|nr:RluA family pseudouridine synthase [Clostridia bacterium]
MRYTVDNISAGKRLDAYLGEITDLSRSAAAKLIESGAVTVSGKRVEKKYQVKEGDEVELTLPEVEEYEAEPENIPLDVVYEDSDIIVINKPSGMVVHPAPGNYTGTLVNALLYHCKESLSGIGGVMRPGIVHRIDKDTSGLLVVAKNDAAHRALSEELGYHGIEREYHALVRGGFKEESGTVDLPIGRHPVDRKKMAVIKSGEGAREAVTHYEVIRAYGQVTYLKLRLETGRTHQIRVHMSYLGHALLGDEVYASTKTLFEKQHAPLFDGQILHARRLSLTHPRTGERMTFECELPDNFKRLIEILEKQY